MQQFKLKAVRLAVLLSITSLSFSAIAAEDSAVDQKNAEKNNEVSLPEVKVQGNKDTGYSPAISTSATKSSAPLRDVPQTVNVIPEQLIRDQGARSMQDVLRNVPGVGMSSGDGARDQVTIRGFSAIGDQFVDGIRDDSHQFRDLSNIERVEVIKGPAAVLYGRGSSGGLINRVTKKPQAGTFGEVTVNFGSNDLKRTSFDANTSVNDNIDFRITGALEDSGSFRDQGFIERGSIAPAVSIKFTEDTKLLVQGEYAEDKRITDFGIPSLNGRPVDVPRSTYYGSGDARRDDTVAFEMSKLTAVFDHRFNDAFSVHNATRYYLYDYDRNNTVQTDAVNTVNLTMARRHAKIDREEDGFFNQTDFIFKNSLGGIKQEWLFGLEFGKQNKDAQSVNVALSAPSNRVNIFNPIGAVIPAPSLADLNADSAIPTKTDLTVLGLYAQNQVTLTPEWKALLGIRYDSYKQETAFDRKFAALSRTDKAWSPRAGLVWQPSETASYYVSYSKSFQPSAESFGLAANNADNKPEVTENREIGAKLDFLDGEFSVTGSLFNLVRSDVKTSDPTRPGVLINAGEQRTNGLEFTANGRLPQGWDVSAGYAYLDGRFTKSNSKQASPQTPVVQIPLEGNRPSLTPKHSAFVWATKQLGSGFSVGGGLNYSDDRFASPSNAVVLPGYLTADLAAYYRSKQFDVAVNLKNVTDKKYIVSGHGGNDNLIIPGAPRELQVGLTYKF